MKNANTRQNPTQNMRYTTKCMTQSAFQKKILSLVQRAGDKVAEAMNIVDELGAITGINVQFERGGRSEQDKCIDVHDKSYGVDEADDIDEFDEASDEASDEIKEVTIPELADMISDRTCFKPECTLCVLNTAFDLMNEQNLMLDLGTFSADTSDEGAEGAEGMDTEDEETYAECGCHDCDNCRHYDDCYGKSDSEYDGYDENSSDDGDDEYNCEDGIDIDDYNDGHECDDDYDDDELASQPTRNTSRSGREW